MKKLDETVKNGEICPICKTQMKEKTIPLFIGEHTVTITYKCDVCGVETSKMVRITDKQKINYDNIRK